MNIKIEFNKEDSDKRKNKGTQWFYGEATIDGKKFEFSLCEMNTNVGGQHTSATELNWIDIANSKDEEVPSKYYAPSEVEKIERLVMNEFEIVF